MGALYKRIVLENGIVEYEHRVVAERMLGRSLMPGEEVHHIDEDKRNNKEENLIVFKTCADHTRFHNGGKLVKNDDGTYSCVAITTEKVRKTLEVRVCQKCGVDYDAKYKEQKFCSPKCAGFSKVDNRPSASELKELLSKNSFEAVGRMYGVSGNSIKKWCKKYEIPSEAKYYKKEKKVKPKRVPLLTIEKANKIRKLKQEFKYTNRELGAMFGVSNATISDVLLNKTYVNK